MAVTPQEHRLTDDKPTGSVWSKTYRRLTVGLVLTVAAAAFEGLAVATIMPATVRDLGGLALYGWAFSAFMLTNLVGITIAGAEADRHGPARPFAAGVGLFSLGLVIAGTAPTMLVVIVGRAVQGFGAGVIGAIAYVVIGRGYPEAARARMLAILSTAWVVPGLVGPALAGLIAAQFGWRWVFLALALPPLLVVTMVLPALHRFDRSTGEAAEWERFRAAAQLAIGAGLFLTSLEIHLWPVTVALLVGGLALAGRAMRWLLPPGTLRAARGLPAGIAAAGLLNLAFFGVDAFVPLTLTAIRGQSVAIAGLPLTSATLGWAAGSWLQSHLAPRQGRRLLVESGLALVAIGVIGIIALLLFATPVVLAVLSWSIAGLGMGLSFSTISLVVLESATPGKEGTASASLQLVNVLGSAFGTGAGGVVVGHTGAATPSSTALLIQDLLMLGAIILTALAALRMPNRPSA